MAGDKVYIVTLSSDSAAAIEILGAYASEKVADQAVKNHPMVPERERLQVMPLDVRDKAPTTSELQKLAKQSSTKSVNAKSAKAEAKNDKEKRKTVYKKADPETLKELSAQAARKTKASSKDEDANDNEDGDDDDDIANSPPAAKKKAAPKRKADGDAADDSAKPKKAKKEVNPVQIQGGKPGSLNGLKLLFTGTFDMGRKEIEATAKHYGAKIVTVLKNTDYIVLGAKPGANKLEEIAEADLSTWTYEDFENKIKA